MHPELLSRRLARLAELHLLPSPGQGEKVAARVPWLALGRFQGARTFYLERRWGRCSKRTCRCSRGQFHGPYHYLRFATRRGQKRRRLYVPRPVVGEVTRWAERCRAARREERAAIRMAIRLFT